MTTSERVLATAAEWSEAGPVAVATVVATTGSAPRAPGAAMVVSRDGRVVGSVSSGCVESTVYELAIEALATGRAGVHRFGAGDGFFQVGPTCGGEIDVLVQRVERGGFAQIAAAVARAEPVTIETVIGGRDQARLGERTVVPGGSVPGDDTKIVTRDGVEVFVQTWAPPPRLLIFGAVDFSAALAEAGRFVGYHVTVCDARSVFTTPERFAAAHDVVVDRPDRYFAVERDAGRIGQDTAVCVLTHDARFDVPVLTRALRDDAVGYIGAMGSLRTHRDRLDRLREAGITDLELERLHSPIGLDLGGRTPEEVAIGIVAEMIAYRSATQRSIASAASSQAGSSIRLWPASSITASVP